MKVLTIQDLSTGAKERWKQQYFVNNVWIYGDEKKVIYENLVSLGDNPEPEQVNEVIGNSSWTRLTCEECNKVVESVVVINASEYSIYLCKKCLSKAVRLIKGI